MMVCIEWESGNITNKALYPTMAYGAGLMLLGVTKGAAARRLDALVTDAQSQAPIRRRRQKARA